MQGTCIACEKERTLVKITGQMHDKKLGICSVCYFDPGRRTNSEEIHISNLTRQIFGHGSRT